MNQWVGCFIKQGLGVVISEVSVLFYKFLYGWRAVCGPRFRFGRGLDICIRRGGCFLYGKVKSRGGLSVFCDGGRVVLGDGVFLNRGCSLNAMSEILIGDGTIFGEDVKIYDHNHVVRSDGVSRGDFTVAGVRIGKGCWIGSNVVILKGVVICDGVTIGAGAVVSKSINEPGVYIARSLGALEPVSRGPRMGSVD